MTGLYLSHHGIKGQKWGVRRYQNRDGSLTPEGKLRRQKALDVNNMDRRELTKMINSGKDFVAKKGTQLYRSTTAEEVTKGKKYVSMRADDISTYHYMVQDLNIDKDVLDTVYDAIKNLNVAGGRTQTKLLQDMYGTQTDKKDKRHSRKELQELVKYGKKSIDEMTNKEFATYMYYNPFGHDFDILSRPSSDPETKHYMDELIKRGYDAVIDLADQSQGYSDGALVVLKTEDSTKRKK